MKNIPLFIDKNKQYWYVKQDNENIICDVTKEIIEDDFLFVVSALDRNSKSNNNFVGVCCLNGFRKLKGKQRTEVFSVLQAVITTNQLLDFTPVYPEFVELGLSKNSDSIYSASELKSENPEHDNWSRALLSAKGLSFEGASIGKVDHKFLEDQEKNVDDEMSNIIMTSKHKSDDLIENDNDDVKKIE